MNFLIAQCLKKIQFLLCIVFFFPASIYAQKSFDLGLENLAMETAKHISTSAKIKIGVWDFVNDDGTVNRIGRYIAEDFSIYLTNNSSEFQVMDRRHLQTILKEHKLNSEGFIDDLTAKELGRLQALDAIVTGIVSVFSDQIKIRVKVLDTETALVIGATMTTLPMNNTIREFLGLPSSSGSSASLTNRALKTDEDRLYDSNISKDCAKNNTGDYCFENKTSKKLNVYLLVKGRTHAYITLQRGESQCFYDLKAGSYSYSTMPYGMQTVIQGFEPPEMLRGNIRVEKCSTKSFVVKVK